jgi:hypothetical protein
MPDELLSADPHADELLSADAGAGTREPFDVKKQNEQMRANMAKQAGAGKQDLLADFATSGPMGVNLEGLNAAHEGNNAKAAHKIIMGSGMVAAPAMLPALGSVAGVAGLAAGLAGGTAGTGLARGAAGLVTDNPDYIDLAGDVGGLAGGIGAAKAGAAAPGLVGRGMTAAGDILESTPTVKQTIGTLLKKGGAKLATGTKTAPVPGLERNMPNVSPQRPAVTLYGPSAEGIGVAPEAAPVAVEPHMPNVSAGSTGEYAPSAEGIQGSVEPHMPNTSAGPEGSRLFAPSAANVPSAPVVEGNVVPPSKTNEMPDAYRAELLKALEARRASNNAAFDAKVAEHGAAPLSPGASPQDVANSYAKSKTLEAPVPHEPVKVDAERGKLIADAYEAMKHDPTNPRVKQAYDALARETADQFYYIKAHTGLQTEAYTGEGNPYKSSAAMMKDVKENNHLFYEPTSKTGALPEDHPMAGTVPTSPTGGEGEMPINDMFRIVHDYFGHAKEGHQFGVHGGENATLAHSKMFSPDARAALMTETRGQNSFVNFGPGSKAPQGQRPFAPQKAGLLPPELRGLKPENVNPGIEQNNAAELRTPEGKAQVAEAGATPTTPATGASRENVPTSETVKKAINHAVNFETANTPTMEVVDNGGNRIDINGSGEGNGISKEAIGRANANAAKGERIAYMDRAGKIQEIADQVNAEDLNPSKGQNLVRVDKAGNAVVLKENGGRSPVGAGNKATSFDAIAKTAAEHLRSGKSDAETTDIIRAALESERAKRLQKADKATLTRQILRDAKDML